MRTPALLLLAACGTSDPAQDTDERDVATPVTVDAGSFDCITDMTRVRGFHVDNLLGDLDATVAVAEDLQGNVFPPGSVVQLVPQEAMVKREPGFSPPTNDWEFFFLGVSGEGTTIDVRGTTETENVFGGNCFSCHAPAQEYDLICEQGHGCDDLPIGPDEFEAIRQADPRCD